MTYGDAVSQLTDDLARVPLFSGLSKRQLRKLAASFREFSYGDGITIVREKQMSGVCFFVIVEGSAVVTIRGRQVATLGPGDYFGELAMISRKERGATVASEGSTRCLVIAFTDFRRFVKENGDVAWKLLEQLADIIAAERERTK